MATVCFYFQVHQPHRLRPYSVFDNDTNYFDEYKNRQIVRKVADKCYMPTNQLMLDLIREHQGRFRIAYSVTGTVLEQFERYAPEIIDSFKALAATGCVEFLGETFYHSLSFLYSRREFSEQIKQHSDMIQSMFGQRPSVFRNTELVYNNDLAHFISQMGFKAILAEGADHVLRGRSPAFLYKPPGCDAIKLLLKNYRLSDDIAFRFSNRGWKEWPLMSDTFADWVHQVNGAGYVVNLFMDYETFGEHQWADTGIFDFMRHLPASVMRRGDNNFMTPSEVATAYPDRKSVV